jgi:TP901 family phage tail tape measure protein
MSRFVLTAQLQLQAPNNVAQVVRQIQNQLNNVNVNVQVQGAAQAQRQLQQVTAQTQAATSAVDRMGRAFAVSVRRFAAFSIATRAVGLFTSTLSDAIKTAIDFEREMVRVSQVTGESLSQLKGFTKTVTNLSTSLGVASSDLVQAGQLILQAGFSAKDTEVALKTLAKAALAPNFDSLSETTEGAIAILAQFGEGVGALEKQLGSINAVAGAFAVEAGDLIDVIRRAGGVFKSSGGDLNELIALFTSVRATTRESAESIGTGLRTIFTRIQRPKTIEYLKQFGVELLDLEGRFVGPFEAVKRLSGALAGLGEGDVTFIRIAEELGGFRQIGKVLPLLQQFTVAQNALNVANKAGNSLTKDAETAQQALAIRIIKVKEEFLALIRGITETKTFQIMANTALSLASALIQIGDAIKPLLPMLATLAAVNLARGIGPFLGSFARGMSSNRTFNKGGKVHHFARGGFVPGTGNRDTVPAMLSPGEFVIRKSSVKKLGAGNLAAMNENRFAVGGIATKNMAGMAIPDTFGKDNLKKSTVSISTKDIASATPQSGMLKSGSLSSLYALKNTKTVQSTLPNKLPISEFNDILQTTYGFGSKSYNTKTAGVASTEKKRFNDILSTQMRDAIKNGAADWSTAVGVPLQASEIKFADTFSLNPGLAGTFFESVIDAFQGRPVGAESSENKRPFDFINGLRGGANARLFNNLNDVDYIDAKKSVTLATESEYKKKIASQLALDGADEMALAVNNRYKTLLSKFNFGGIIQKFASGGEVVKRGTINYLKSDVVKAMASMGLAYDDFFKKIPAPNSAFSQFMVGGQGPDAKPFPKTLLPYSPTPETQLAMERGEAEKNARIQSALERQGRSMREYEGQTREQKAYMANRSFMGRRRFATGGDVGTDTVPALLTPGEFVIKRSSAQRIGYGNLNRMNKVGRYAQGGVVQRFAAGTTGTGVKPKGDVLFDRIAFNGISKAEKSISKFVFSLDSITGGGLYKLGIGLQFLYAKVTGTATASTMLQKSTSVLNSVLPDFTKIIEQNSKVNKRSRAKHEELITVIGNNFERMLKSGQSQQEIAKAANAYANALNKNTALLQQGATLPQIAGSQPSRNAPAQTQPAQTRPTNQFSAFSRHVGGSAPSTQTNNTGGNRGMAGVVSDNKMFAASMAASLVQGFLPAIEENSSATLRLTHSFLGLVTTITSVGFALEAFGVKLGKGQLMDFLGGKGVAARGANVAARGAVRSVGTGISNIGLPGFDKLGSGISKLAQPIGNIAQGFTKLLGPVAAAAATFYIMQTAGNAFIDAIYNYETRIKKAVESGNIEQARTLGAEQQRANTGVNVVAGISAGAVLGGLLGGPFGAALGAAAGGAIAGYLSESSKYAGQVAATQAALVKSQKTLSKASEDAAKALSDFEKGNISATDLLKSSSGATSAVAQSRAEANKLTTESNKELQSETGFKAGTRNILTLGGLLGETSGQKRSRIESEQKKSTQDVQKQEEEAIRVAQPAMNALAKQVAMTNGSFDDLMNRIRETDPNLYDILIRQGTNDLNKNFQNLSKEAARTKAALEASNLGLRNAQATSTAMSASMNKFAAGLEVGGNMFVANTEFLSQAMTSAAQSMNPDDIKAAVTDVSRNLSSMGISKTFTDKFEGNTNAFIQAQQNYGKAFDNIISESKAMGKVFSADELKTKFADQLGSMMGSNVSDEAKKNLKAIIENIDLNPDEINEIMSGNYQAFGDKLSEAGKKQFEEIMKIAQERQKAEQVIIDLTKQRIEAERNLVNAQREAVDLYMEGRDIQAKYGGQAVSTQERRGAILAKANAGAARMGLGQMRTGSVAELRARNNQILTGFGGIEARRSVQGGMQGVEGANAAGTQQDLQQAQKDQVQTIRDLIKLEEEELKIIQEKNRLEKDSLESLISGDIEKFFEQQAAVGAQAAIATGDTSLANMFGASAIGAAFKDIQRMQEAGVQSLFGRQLGGPGGLAEQAAGAALGARGVMDPRMAQRLAGTTAEEEATKGRLRELGGVLGETGAVGAAMAEMQVQTASINVGNATLELQKIEERGRAVAAGMYRGGTVYANRGMFVPRGTDTVPAMLTPGEFVVRREAVNRGNNLQLLRAINSGGNTGGFARGGKVGYYNNGGIVQYKALGDLIARAGQAIGIDPKIITNLGNVFTSFTNSFNESIKNLQNTKLQIKLDSVNVNVNLNGTSMLTQISEQTRKEIVGQVIDKLKNEYGVGNNGKLTQNTSNLPKMA